MRTLAHIGIVSLVDEATSFQEVRDKLALQAILDAYLRKELAVWAKRFPDEFYQHIFRLREWEWKGRGKNPRQVVASYTKDIVYARLAPHIMEELEKRNPISNGRRRGAHHQWLTEDVGHPALAQHLHAVITLTNAGVEDVGPVQTDARHRPSQARRYPAIAADGGAVEAGARA